MAERERRATAREREIRRVLGELDRSGLTLAEFARRRGIPAGTLGWWRFELRRRQRPAADGRRQRRRQSAPEFVELVRVQAPPPDDMSERSGGFELVLGRGRTVRVPESFDATALKRLVTALEAAC